MDTIGRDELRAVLDTGGVTLIEALSVASYDAEHLPGARNVPGDLTADPATRLAPTVTPRSSCTAPGPAVADRGSSPPCSPVSATPTYASTPAAESTEPMPGCPFEGTRCDPATGAA
jgi:hypothetical protein